MSNCYPHHIQMASDRTEAKDFTLYKVAQKTALASRFLERKMAGYEALKAEIEALQLEEKLMTNARHVEQRHRSG